MGKQCLAKLNGNITVDCTIPHLGVKNLYIMHVEDTTPVGVPPAQYSVGSIVFASDAVVIRVEGYKQNIQVTGAARNMDASTKMDINIIFKMSFGPAYVGRTRSLLTGRFYVLIEEMGGLYKFVGYTSPLECSSMEWDSNSNAGMATVTLSAPEGSAGNYFMAAEAAAIRSIKAKVGV